MSSPQPPDFTPGQGGGQPGVARIAPVDVPAVLGGDAQGHPVVAAGGEAEVFGDQFRFDVFGLDRRGMAGEGEGGEQQAEGRKTGAKRAHAEGGRDGAREGV